MATEKRKVAIVGSSGYTGGELFRLLLQHPRVEITAVTSEKSAGKPISTIFPNLTGFSDLLCEPLDPDTLSKKADIVLLALPHIISQETVFQFHRLGVRVVDLSADYRLVDPMVYRQWYEHDHQYPELLKIAVYGLPELHREKIKESMLIANPGCYPTGAILGIAPLVQSGWIDPQSIIIDAKSGVSGAGRSPALTYHYPEVNEGFMAYKIGVHRHTPEIEQELSSLFGGNMTVSFTPHLVPMNRGILTTIYATAKEDTDSKQVHALYEEFFSGEPFVRLLALGQFPNVRNVRGSNVCQVGVAFDSRTNRFVIVTALDNLVKGAAGQAIQNMNLILGFKETEGLMFAGMFL